MPSADDMQRAALRGAVASLFERFRSGTLRPGDILGPADEGAANEAAIDPPLIDAWLAQRTIIEPDILPFRHLDDPAAVVVDVGAHSGYTAVSLRNLPLRCWIHSFEPNDSYNAMLARLWQVDSKYSFANVACSDVAGTAEAYNLAVNGVLIGGTASIGGATFEGWLADYLSTRLGESWLPLREGYDARLRRMTFRTSPLDDLVATRSNDWPHLGRRIVGLKIDVEGHELPMLRGSQRVLAEHRPLVMIELVPAHEGAASALMPEYVLYERVEDRLRPARGHHYNAYFVHRERLGEYVARGLIEP